MKKLKDGDLVFHKKFGQGIAGNTEKYCEIHFQSGLKRCPRSELFIKGDQVLIKRTSKSYGSHSFNNFDQRRFIAYAPQCKKHKYAVSHIIDGEYQSIHTYMYVYDIRHIDSPIVQQFDFAEMEKRVMSFTDMYSSPSGRCHSDCANYSEIPKDEDYQIMMKHLKRMEIESELKEAHIKYAGSLKILESE